MPKNLVRRSFSLIAAILVLNAKCVYCQNTLGNMSCFIAADGVKIELSSNIYKINKMLPFSKNIEYSEKSSSLYHYDMKSYVLHNLLIKPSLDIYVDNSSGNINKYVLIYDTEKVNKNKSPDLSSLNSILPTITKNNISFLHLERITSFNRSKNSINNCASVNVEATKSDFYMESTIIVTITKQ